MFEIYQIFLLILLPILGIIILLYALFYGERLASNPIIFILERPKIEFKSDLRSLVILLGCFMMVFGVWIWSNTYKNTVKELKDDLKLANNEITTRNNLLKEFKNYSMRFPLTFPKDELINAANIKVQVYIQKQGMESPMLCDSKKIVGLNNEISVNIDYLNHGDKLSIKAYEGQDKEWNGINLIKIPETIIEMQRVR